MIFKKVGLLSTILAITLVGSLREVLSLGIDNENYGDSQKSFLYDTYHSMKPNNNRDNTGAIVGYRNYPLRNNEQEGGNGYNYYQYNTNQESSRENIKINTPIHQRVITEYLLRRSPLTGRIEVVKVSKYVKDKDNNGAGYAWKELPWQRQHENDKESHDSQVINSNTESNQNIDNNHKHVKKQLKEGDINYHKSTETSTEVKGNEDNIYKQGTHRSVLMYKLFKKSIPLLGSAWMGIIPRRIQNSKTYGGYRGQVYNYPSNTGYVHKKATVCIANGNPEACRRAIQLMLYLQSILRARKSQFNQQSSLADQKSDDSTERKESDMYRYLKIMSQLIGKNANPEEESFQNNNRPQNILWNVLNLFSKIFKENVEEMRNQTGKTTKHDENNTVEKLISILKKFFENDGNNNEGQSDKSEESPLQRHSQAAEETNNSSFADIAKELGEVSADLLNVLFRNKTNGLSSKDKQIIEEIKDLWMYVFNKIFNIASRNQHVGNSDYLDEYKEMLFKVKNITDHIMDELISENTQDVHNSQIVTMMRNIKKMLGCMWSELFAYFDIDEGTNIYHSENETEGANGENLTNDPLVTLEKVWKYLFHSLSNIDSHFDDTDESSIVSNVPHENRNGTDSPDKYSTTSKTDKLDNGEDKENNATIDDTVIESENRTWEDLIQDIMSSVNGIYEKYNVTNYSSEGDEERGANEDEKNKAADSENEEKIKNKVQDIFNAISNKFETSADKEAGTEEDNNWEDLLHNILYNENEIREGSSKDESTDIWGYLKHHLEPTGEIDHQNSTDNNINSINNTKDSNDDTNDAWNFIVNNMFGSGSEVDEDSWEEHKMAWNYIQNWIENYTDSLNEPDEIWKHVINITQINLGKDHTTKTIPTVNPVSDTSGSNNITFVGFNNNSGKETVSSTTQKTTS